jgi:hypothetical protein
MYPLTFFLPVRSKWTNVSDLSFSNHFPVMVRSGLAWSHVQPVLENKSSYWLLAASYWRTQVCGLLEASG